MTFKDLLERLQRRTAPQEQIVPTTTELISEERLYAPLTGEKINNKVRVNEIDW